MFQVAVYPCGSYMQLAVYQFELVVDLFLGYVGLFQRIENVEVFDTIPAIVALAVTIGNVIAGYRGACSLRSIHKTPQL
jgi:hypothetical protein